MRQEATRSLPAALRGLLGQVRRRMLLAAARGAAPRRLCRWMALAAWACALLPLPPVHAAEPAPLLHALTIQLASPAQRVLALTCPGLAPSDLVHAPQRPGTPDPSTEAPQVPTVMVVDAQHRRSRVRLEGGTLLLEPLGPCRLPPPLERPDLVDGGRVSVGTGFIAEAWLADATLRYRHGILGDIVTAAELRVTNRQGDTLRYRLPEDAVFEDRWARLVYLDGQDAVLVVRSGLKDGSALALYGLDRAATDANALVPLAQAAPLGAEHRWLNPIGVGDFDGSGRTQIAAVLTPHSGGVLAVYQRQGAQLVERYRAGGFSNHQIYSAELGMSALLDVNGDGVVDLAVPDAARKALRVVTFAQGRFKELQRIPHDSPIVTGIAVQRLSPAGPSLVYGLEDGTLVVVTK